MHKKTNVRKFGLDFFFEKFVNSNINIEVDKSPVSKRAQDAQQFFLILNQFRGVEDIMYFHLIRQIFFTINNDDVGKIRFRKN